MKQQVLNSVTILSLLVLAAVGSLIVINFSQLSGQYNSLTHMEEETVNAHYMVILDGSDRSDLDEINRGLAQAATDNHVVYELWSYTGEDKVNQILRQMDIAIESSVDGIIVEAFRDERFTTLLEKANTYQIPVTVIGEDIASVEKVSYISYNHYHIGTQIAHVLAKVFLDKGIVEGTIILMQGVDANSQYRGVAINEMLPESFTIQPESLEYYGEDALNAEGATRSILEDISDVVAIVCSSSQETRGVIQALKDSNQIHDVLVIGDDDEPDILEYIRRGIIYATVVTDKYQMGYDAVEDLTRYIRGDFVSQYKDINVTILTEETLQMNNEERGSVDEP